MSETSPQEDSAGEEPGPAAEGADGESAERPRRVRTLVLGVVTLLFVVGLFAQDTRGNIQLLRCATGQGFAMTTMDGRAFTRDYHGYKLSGTVNNLIDFKVLLYGSYEPQVLALMEAALKAKRSEGGVFLDVGANIGTHSLYMASRGFKVQAIEPWPTILKRLLKTLKENNIEQITVHPVGFAAKKGTMPFHMPPDFNLGWGSFSNSYAKSHYDSRTIDLPLVVGDRYLASKSIERIDLIKVDIEGFEKFALAGLRKTLERNRPVVVFELNVTNAEGFHSEAELRAVFPKDYTFMEILPAPEFVWRPPGDRIVMCMDERLIYELEPLPMRFDVDGGNVVALPNELLEKLPQQSE